MKTCLMLTILCATTCLHTVAYAENDWYYGGKLGFMQFDPKDFEDPINAAAVIGYQFWRGVSAEGEISTSLSDGKQKIFATRYDVSIQTVAAYASYRSSGETYFKVKYGFANNDLEIGAGSRSDTVDSYGIGYGWKTLSDLRFEVEYTVISNEVNFLSFGLLF